MSETLFSNVKGFLAAKRALDAVAAEVLCDNMMREFPSFVVEKGVRQPDATLDAVYAAAARAHPHMVVVCSHLLKEAGITDGAAEVRLPTGEKLMVDDAHAFTRLTLPALKGRARAEEKVKNDYNHNASRLVDVVRASIVCDAETQLAGVARALERLASRDDAEPISQLELPESENVEALDGLCEKFRVSGFAVVAANRLKKTCPRFTVARLKNRFAAPLYNGYRDALYNIQIFLEDGTYHVCELQLHLAAVVAHKKRSHGFYEFFRSFFGGNMAAVDDRMRLLAALDGGHDSLAEAVAAACAAGDARQLATLGDLLAMLGEWDHAVSVLTARIDAIESSDVTFLCFAANLRVERAKTLFKATRFAEAEAEAISVRDELRQSHGRRHAETLRCSCVLASALAATGRYEQALAIFSEALTAQEATLGPDALETNETLSQQVLCLDKMGKKAEAEPLYTRIIAWRTERLGPNHADTLSSISNYGYLLAALGHLDAAATQNELAHDRALRTFGHGHELTKRTAADLANVYLQVGREDEAMQLFLTLDA